MKYILIATTLIGLASTSMLEKRGYIPDSGTFSKCLGECYRCYVKWNAATDNAARFFEGNCKGTLQCGPSVDIQAAANVLMCSEGCFKHAIEDIYSQLGKCCNAGPKPEHKPKHPSYAAY